MWGFFRFKLTKWPGYGSASQFTYLTEPPAGPGALPGPRRQVGGGGGRLGGRLLTPGGFVSSDTRRVSHMVLQLAQRTLTPNAVISL